MYELKKKIGKVFTSKFVVTGPSSYKKRIYRAAVSQRLRNTNLHVTCYSKLQWVEFYSPLGTWSQMNSVYTAVSFLTYIPNIILSWTPMPLKFSPCGSSGSNFRCVSNFSNVFFTWPTYLKLPWFRDPPPLITYQVEDSQYVHCSSKLHVSRTLVTHTGVWTNPYSTFLPLCPYSIMVFCGVSWRVIVDAPFGLSEISGTRWSQKIFTHPLVLEWISTYPLSVADTIR